MSQAQTKPEEIWHDLQPLLDEELNALPDKYRAPVLLCYVEGKTNAEAARRLGWPIGTVKGRLARARELLKNRLARRGITLSGGLLSVMLGEHASAAVPGLLAHSTIQTVASLAAGSGTPGLAAASAVALAEGVLKTMFATKLKTAIVFLFTVGVLGLGVGTVTSHVSAKRQAEAAIKAEAQARPPKKEQTQRFLASQPEQVNPGEKNETTITGRVVDFKGSPLADAQVAFCARSRRPVPPGMNPSELRDEMLGETTSDREGHFHLQVPRTSAARFWQVFLLGRAAAHGIGWEHLNADGEQPEVTLRLPVEQVIRGRLIDLQGQPAAGVRISVISLGKIDCEGFTGINLRHPPKELSLWPAPVTTDKQGRFILRGLNREQGVMLGIRDEPYARLGLQLPTDASKKNEEIISTAPPSQIITGRVTYAGTGKPVHHARVQAGGADAWTNDEGRFRLNPYPGDHYDVNVYAPEGEPSLSLGQGLKWPKGAAQQEINFALPRGVLVRGKITEGDSGKPVAGASIQFVPRQSGPDPGVRHALADWESAVLSDQNGSFRIAVPPAEGSLFIHGPSQDHVLREVLSNRLFYGKPGGHRMYAHAVVLLDLRPRWDLLKWIAGSWQTKEIPVVLQRGVTVKGRVVAPNGEPAREVILFCRLFDITPLNFQPVSMVRSLPILVRNGYFELHGCDPQHRCRAFFVDARNKLGAVMNISGKQASEEPITVRLAPCGSAEARFLDAQGNPLVNYHPHLKIVLAPGAHLSYKAIFQQHLLIADEEFVGNIDRLNHWDRPRTDAQGRCTFTALIPGVTYRITPSWEVETVPEFTVESGQLLHLPDITVGKRPG